MTQDVDDDLLGNKDTRSVGIDALGILVSNQV
jgi:hypothetical protein